VTGDARRNPNEGASERALRRAALLIFPKHSLSEKALDRIVEEGFTDVGIGVVDAPAMKDQGFTLEQAERLAQMCLERKLGIIAFTGYMKYQEALVAAEPHRLMITGSKGKVHDLDGLPVRWLCPFRPENKTLYLSLLLNICRWPAVREIHLNDEASIGFGGGVIGCYCDYCREQFHARTGADPPAMPDWDDPLWYAWLEHRFENWTAVHAELREDIKKVRPDVLVGIQHSPYIPERVYNAWESGICLARDAAAQDVICTDPYHFNHADGIRHRPHRRILTEGTRSLVGACVNRAVTIYPQGFMPPAQAVPMGRQDGLLAGVVPFALGADTVMPFTYELMKIIPGFFEAFQQARKLLPHFQTHRPYAFATMLCPQQSEIYGHYEGNWGATYLTDMADLVFRTGLPWRWFWDQRLDDAGDGLRGPLILPEVHCLTASQLGRIQAVAERGEGLLWVGNTPQTPWAGSGPCKLPAPVRTGVFEMRLEPGHPLTEGLEGPVILSTCVDSAPPRGEVLGTVEGRPALVVAQDGARRAAWIAGMPALRYFGATPGAYALEATSNVELLRRLMLWAGAKRPLVRLEPFPPMDDYRTLRPADRRAVPTIELLPMVRQESPSRLSVLAIVFPYTPVGCETSLVIEPPDGAQPTKATELWLGEDWTGRLQQTGDGVFRIPLRIPGDCDLVALLINLD